VRPDAFVESLAAASFGEAFNFYREGEGAGLRCQRVRAYLEARAGAPLLLVGEAPGYRGTRVSGIPFTSERQISGTGPAEATATVVHRVLAELGIEDETLLWNAVPGHPHLPGRPLTNRRPARGEVESGRPFLAALSTDRRVIAVGRVARAALGLPCVRHPARGGAAAVRAGLSNLL
jgi:uracil-DNA glycosylase